MTDIANVVRAQPPLSRWRLCQCCHHKGVVAIIALALCLSCWHQHLCIGIIANVALAPLPSSRSHHTVVFVNLALVVSLLLC
jgi:hypothetical protein